MPPPSAASRAAPGEGASRRAAMRRTAMDGAAWLSYDESLTAQMEYRELRRIDVNDEGAAAALEAFRLGGEPVVVTGHKGWTSFADAWLKDGRFDMEAMERDIGDEIVPVVARNYNDQKPISRYMRLSTFLEQAWVPQSDTLYLHQWQFPLSATAQERMGYKWAPLPLFGDNLLKFWLDRCRCDNPLQYIFMGPAGTLSKIHKDNGGLVITISPIVGRKEVVLMHRDDTNLLHGLNFDAFNIDFEEFPLVALAKRWRGVLQPGEILVLPEGTYHACRNLDACLSYSHFHLDTQNLNGFVKSAYLGDAPEIYHEEIVWNAAIDTMAAMDNYVDAVRVAAAAKHTKDRPPQVAADTVEDAPVAVPPAPQAAAPAAVGAAAAGADAPAPASDGDAPAPAGGRPAEDGGEGGGAGGAPPGAENLPNPRVGPNPNANPSPSSRGDPRLGGDPGAAPGAAPADPTMAGGSDPSLAARDPRAVAVLDLSLGGEAKARPSAGAADGAAARGASADGPAGDGGPAARPAAGEPPSAGPGESSGPAAGPAGDCAPAAGPTESGAACDEATESSAVADGAADGASSSVPMERWLSPKESALSLQPMAPSVPTYLDADLELIPAADAARLEEWRRADEEWFLESRKGHVGKMVRTAQALISCVWAFAKNSTAAAIKAALVRLERGSATETHFIFSEPAGTAGKDPTRAAEEWQMLARDLQLGLFDMKYCRVPVPPPLPQARVLKAGKDKVAPRKAQPPKPQPKVPSNKRVRAKKRAAPARKKKRKVEVEDSESEPEIVEFTVASEGEGSVFSFEVKRPKQERAAPKPRKVGGAAELPEPPKSDTEDIGGFRVGSTAFVSEGKKQRKARLRSLREHFRGFVVTYEHYNSFYNELVEENAVRPKNGARNWTPRVGQEVKIRWGPNKELFSGRIVKEYNGPAAFVTYPALSFYWDQWVVMSRISKRDVKEKAPPSAVTR